jgi:hypothetical protein
VRTELERTNMVRSHLERGGLVWANVEWQNLVGPNMERSRMVLGRLGDLGCSDGALHRGLGRHAVGRMRQP